MTNSKKSIVIVIVFIGIMALLFSVIFGGCDGAVWSRKVWAQAYSGAKLTLPIAANAGAPRDGERNVFHSARSAGDPIAQVVDYAVKHQIPYERFENSYGKSLLLQNTEGVWFFGRSAEMDENAGYDCEFSGCMRQLDEEALEILLPLHLIDDPAIREFYNSVKTATDYSCCSSFVAEPEEPVSVQEQFYQFYQRFPEIKAEQSEDGILVTFGEGAIRITFSEKEGTTWFQVHMAASEA